MLSKAIASLLIPKAPNVCIIGDRRRRNRRASNYLLRKELIKRRFKHERMRERERERERKSPPKNFGACQILPVTLAIPPNVCAPFLKVRKMVACFQCVHLYSNANWVAQTEPKFTFLYDNANEIPPRCRYCGRTLHGEIRVYRRTNCCDINK
jgi:hypothetical protein